MAVSTAVNEVTPLTLFCFNLLHLPPYSTLPFLRSLSPIAATTVERSDKHSGGFTVGRLLPLSSPTSGGDNGGKNKQPTVLMLETIGIETD
ncbi:hypothetical protein Lal_00027034 [Lupinus albus]|nr:hypothetical protein Lal_00027034 [Lupinus albus]